jgi:cobalt/nickel transport system permease protein
VLVMTAVVATQALIFQDGGLLALGANLFNMAVIGVAVSYGVYQVFRKISRGQKWGVFAGGFAAAWMSIFIASLAAAMQLAASGTSPANLALPAMAGIHALIGIGEGLITVGALSFIYAARRDLLKLEKAQPSGARGVLWVGLAIALLLAALSPLASANPDGLEWVAEQQGFLNQVKAPLFSLIPDYIVPGLSNETLATIAAGVIGVLVVMGVAIGVGAARRKRNITG